MTPAQAAALIWAAGTAITAVLLARALDRALDIDPITGCDRCRNRRRRAGLLTAGPTPVLAVCLIVAAACWPVIAPVSGAGDVRRLLRTRALRHRCARSRG